MKIILALFLGASPALAQSDMNQFGGGDVTFSSVTISGMAPNSVVYTTTGGLLTACATCFSVTATQVSVGVLLKASSATVDGTLGVGTASPADTVEIKGLTPILRITDTTSGGRADRFLSGGGGVGNFHLYDGTQGRYRWRTYVGTNASQDIFTLDHGTFAVAGSMAGGSLSGSIPAANTILWGGNVGIGDNSPDTQAGLEILSAASPANYALAVSSQSDTIGSLFGVNGAGHVFHSSTTFLSNFASPTGQILCLTAAGALGHCTSGASCLTTCTCTCIAN